jgi:hypothetical protein
VLHGFIHGVTSRFDARWIYRRMHMLVELRWRKAFEWGEGKYVVEGGSGLMVLQYRTYSLDTSRAPVSSWSEWEDVPLEGATVPGGGQDAEITPPAK